MEEHTMNEFQLNEFKESFWLLDKENTGRVTVEKIVNHFKQLGMLLLSFFLMVFFLNSKGKNSQKNKSEKHCRVVKALME
jgi:Ca2+-binding EF-hand superfamily protein